MKPVYALLSAFCINASLATGMPVVDVANLVQTIEQLTQMRQQYMVLQEQFNTAKNIYDTAKDQFAGARGVRDAYKLLNTPEMQALRQQIPEEYQKITELAKSLRPGALEATLLNNQHAQETVAAMRTALMEEAGMWKRSFDDSKQRFQDIQQLMDKIRQSPDQKDILDLQARLMSEQQFLTLEATRLTSLSNMAQVRFRALLQQQDQQIRMMGRRSLDSTPVNPFAR